VSELAAARERFLAQAAARAREAAPPWLAALRSAGAAAFADAGLPGTDLEEWRYTNVAPLARIPFEPAPPGGAVGRAELELLAVPLFACSAFVFVDGRFARALSSPRALAGDLCVASLAALARARAPRPAPLGELADPKLHPFAALQGALVEDGAVVTIPAGVECPQPIHLVFVTTGAAGEARASFPRVVVAAERGSRALVVQDHVSLGAGPRLVSAVTEVAVGPGAAVELVVLQREGEEGFHVGNVQARVERDGRFAARTLVLGGRLVRNDLGVLLAGPGAECDLDGLFHGAGERLVDNHTLVDHASPHATSRELYKGVLGGRSRGVFRGRVVVRPDAQKSDARQASANLLLSDGAEIDTKPQLEIWADDVRCSHGATIGRLDPEALFYLRSRGLDEGAARDLLTRGFAAEILQRIGSAALAEAAGELLLAALRADAGR
jgi:Fe-S cluster assembly protein SufD